MSCLVPQFPIVLPVFPLLYAPHVPMDILFQMIIKVAILPVLIKAVPCALIHLPLLVRLVKLDMCPSLMPFLVRLDVLNLVEKGTPPPVVNLAIVKYHTARLATKSQNH